MSKLAIILCAVFFTSAANVSFKPNTVESTKLYAQRVIDRAFRKVEQQSEIVKHIAQAIAEMFVNRTTDFNYKFRNEVIFILTSTIDEITHFGMEAAGANVTECGKFSSELSSVAYSVFNKTYICANDQLDTRLQAIDVINKIFIDAFANLTEISEVSDHCDDNVRNRESSYKAMACNQLAAMKATSIVDNIVELTPFWITKLDFLLKTFDLSLNNCKADNGHFNFYQDSVASISDTEACVQRIVRKLNKTKVADVSSQPISLENVQRQMQQVINDTFTKVQNESEIIQKMGKLIAEKLMNETTKFKKQFVDDTAHMLGSSHDTGLFMNIENVNIIDRCGQVASRFFNDVYAVINRTEKCANTQRDTRLKQIDNSSQIFDEQVAKFINISEVMNHCRDNVWDRESSYVAMSCMQLAASNATTIFELVVELSTIASNGFNMLLDTFQDSLVNCRRSVGYFNLPRQAVDIYENITICIQRMTDETA